MAKQCPQEQLLDIPEIPWSEEERQTLDNARKTTAQLRKSKNVVLREEERMIQRIPVNQRSYWIRRTQRRRERNERLNLVKIQRELVH